ncbi:MAG TPA: YceI family protein [Chitinophagales bacterium]|nr:YceI family protein [Chitinophagales bacterium]HQD11964.1 YceI family protein [Chitinophagales bacterium]HQO30968.1 YceI family protein [Chitinophagales bacterium]
MQAVTKQTFLFLLFSVMIFAGFAQGKIAVSTEKSTIEWIGRKVLSQHNGNVKLQSGTISLKNGVLNGGTFVMDMNSITCADIENPDYNQKLVGHLKNEDFFNVAKFPTATVVIKKVFKVTGQPNVYKVTADLTIKGITKSITFPATVKMTGKALTANAKITIDRTLWDIKYGSASFIEGLGDKAIKNEIELNVNLAN